MVNGEKLPSSYAEGEGFYEAMPFLVGFEDGTNERRAAGNIVVDLKAAAKWQGGFGKVLMFQVELPFFFFFLMVNTYTICE